MTASTPSTGLFGIAPGVAFPDAFVSGFLARFGDRPPEAQARITVFLNSARMLSAVRDAFCSRGVLLLPRLMAVADLGTAPHVSLPRAVPALRRQLVLSQLVERLIETAPGLAPGHSVSSLAQSLAALIDEFQSEGVSLDALGPDLAEGHAEHWQRSLRFLSIIRPFLDGSEGLDAQARQRLAVEALIRDWDTSAPVDPVIIAGSTGSRGSTFDLMTRLARLSQGAVVLPGFDFDCPAPVWRGLARHTTAPEEHPQFRFVRLAEALGVDPGTIPAWDRRGPPSPARNRLVSLALRPAPVTDRWLAEGESLGDLMAATRDLTLIEAASPQAEAEALALCLIEAARQGHRTALVTPDRTLARRVGAALDRWSVIPDDSAGEPLSQTAPGRFLRLVARLMTSAPTAESLLSVLRHPLAASGSEDRAEHLRLSRELELHLRRHGPAFPQTDDILAWAAAEKSRDGWSAWLAHALRQATPPEQPQLERWTEGLVGLAEHVAAGPGHPSEAGRLWDMPEGMAARSRVAELLGEAKHGGSTDAWGFLDRLEGHLAGQNVRGTVETHPLIAIWGTLEARVLGADLVILGGLNEGVWPPSPAPDPWLSRQMRRAAGLLSPERSIGLAAHDFQQAVCATQVVLSRALRDDRADTVASRLLQRITNLLDGLPAQSGPQALAEMRARGAVWTTSSRRVFRQASKVKPATRPSPVPPAGAHPRRISVTQVGRLIRDPYAIYARDVLRLSPLDPLGATPDPRLRGETLHRIVEEFVRAGTAGLTEAELAASLLASARRVLWSEVAWPASRVLWLARIRNIAPTLAAQELRRASQATPVILEERARLSIDPLDVELTARPDRIDVTHDGLARIYDYKSGRPPTERQRRLFDKQLPLEAIMVRHGAFGGIGTREVECGFYLHLGGTGDEIRVEMDAMSLTETWTGLRDLLAAFRNGQTGYTARRAMERETDTSDYDHLSRFGEWLASDDPVREELT